MINIVCTNKDSGESISVRLGIGNYIVTKQSITDSQTFFPYALDSAIIKDYDLTPQLMLELKKHLPKIGMDDNSFDVSAVIGASKNVNLEFHTCSSPNHQTPILALCVGEQAFLLHQFDAVSGVEEAIEKLSYFLYSVEQHISFEVDQLVYGDKGDGLAHFHMDLWEAIIGDM